MMKKTILSFLLIAVALTSQAQTLQQNFETPPNSAKPRVWWHWMNGNITKDGIQKDLDWMTRIGIGGFQNFDASLFTPVVVPKKLVFMTPEWKDAFKFTTELADKKGLEMAIAGSPGWSVTGGPWVEPKDGMKKYVWTETQIAGEQAFSGKLPQPSDVAGSFQNVPIAGGAAGGYVGERPKFYHDAMVIAYRLPKNEIRFTDLKPKVSSSGGDFIINDLTDGDLNKTSFLPPAEVGQDMWVQYEFETPQTFKAFTIVGANHNGMEQFFGGPLNRALKVSDDGINFREIAKVSGSIVPQNTVAISPTTAKYWRITFRTLPGAVNPLSAMMGMKGEAPKPDGVNVAEFILYNTNRIDQYEDKAGFDPWKEGKDLRITNDDLRLSDTIPTNDVIDLTSFMQPDGTLIWNAPFGSWGLLRFGYSITGRQNHPASPEATGLEVDKLDKEAVKKYINTYLDMYKDATGGMMGAKGVKYMVLDSYEAGHMNWTKTFPEEFKKRRGYDLKTYLPVLTGRVIKSIETSEKFLWDFRKTIGELIAENHYDVIGEELHKRGMKRYTESHEGGRVYLADGMDVKRNADIPMSAMWTPGSLGGGSDEEIRSEADIRESASVANIYGQNIVAAESMTSVGRAFQEYPERLKRTADLEMASGLNRFVIHTSVHQPLDDKKPGFSLGPFGQYFTRQETWAESGGKAWIGYLGRSSYMLQQGKNVANILWYYGENQNLTWLYRGGLPAVPAGYEYDFVNSSALINAISVKDGKLVAKSGNKYEILVLDETAKYMTLPVLKRLRELVKAGAKISGTKPEASPSLGDNAAEFQNIVDEIWKGENITTIDKINTQPDVIITKNTNKILFRHRTIAPPSGGGGVDIYWLNNRSDDKNAADISFRIAGKIPELWNPVTGKTEKVSYQIKYGRTIIPLTFESWDAYFIVFKDATKINVVTIKSKTEKEVLTIMSPWSVTFEDNTATFDKLTSWSENTDSDIKYFSGTAIYKNTFNIKTPITGLGFLDLGSVKNIAEVIVNGKSLGTVWKKPFRVELGNALKAGENTIEIKVTNLWVNRLIGDAQPDVKQKTTFTTMPFYKGSEALMPSGLMGPVRVLMKE